LQLRRFASVSGCALLLVTLLPVVSLAAAPVGLNPMLRAASSSSLNWAGYFVTGSSGSVTGAQGSFVVPSVSCSKGTSYVALWAGIDGATDSTVEQAGVMAECSHGSAVYSAWTEFYPAAPTYAAWTPAPGDIVSVTIGCSAVTGGASCVAIVADQTSGQSYSGTSTVSGASLANAECIAERPSIGGSITKLANFGTAEFGQDYTGVAGTCYATIGGTTSAFGGIAGVTSITMVDNHGHALATPSPLTADGSSFTVAYGSGSSGGGGGGHGHKP
jgi:Peptidase A4 family